MGDQLSREAAESLLQAISGLIKALALYPEGHASVTRAEKHLARLSTRMFNHRRKILIGLSEGYIVVGGQPFMGVNLWAEELGKRLQRRGVEGVIVAERARGPEWRRFCDWLRRDSDAAWTGSGIALTRVERSRSTWNRARQLHAAAIGALEDVYRGLEEGGVPDAGRARRCVEEFTELLGDSPTILRGLVLIKNYDQYTFHHSVNVCVLALGLGNRLGLSPGEQEHLGFGALLHDVGKTRTPHEVVRKPGKLSTREWTLIWKHPEHGRDILEEMGDGLREAPRIVLEHHMLPGGQGYPARGRDYETSGLSRLVTIADIYDAMTTHRPYSTPLPFPEAVRAMRRLGGSHFDPDALAAFLSMIGEIPVGSMVRLRSGEVAVVSRLDDAGCIAEVHPVLDASGRRIGPRDGAPRPLGPADIVHWVDPLVHGIDLVRVLSPDPI